MKEYIVQVSPDCINNVFHYKNDPITIVALAAHNLAQSRRTTPEKVLYLAIEGLVYVENEWGQVEGVLAADVLDLIRSTADIREGSTQDLITKKCDQVKDLLLRKNADYGNSALDPVRIFSKADAEEQIRVRIDDKLSRLAGAGEKNFTEDTVMDLVGYLILLMVKMEGENGKG